MSFIKKLLPLSKKSKKDLYQVASYLEKDDVGRIKKLLKIDKVGIAYTSLKVSEKLVEDETYPVVNAAVEEQKIVKLTEEWNNIIEQKVREKKYQEFSLEANNKMLEFLSPHLVGLDEIKEAAILQLFSSERIHLLLLGDPGTGKTDILRAVDELAPISSYGLGSGTSSAGLTATYKGDELIEGLLPMADEGICCVDELNLMKARDRGSLLNAMEKGFVTYDKGNKHKKLDARISLLATANPKGDKFVGRKPDTWLKQIPFDTALLTRFHLVFFVRNPETKEFVDIAKKIVNERQKNLEINDALFIRDYIEFSHMIEIRFEEKLKKQIVDFSAKLKKDEDKFLVEVTPRLVLGIIRLAKASARLELRTVAEQKDLDKVFKLVEKSLYVK